MIKQIIDIILISSALMMGCGTATTITAANVDHPVLLGKIRSIQKLESERIPIRVPFNISNLRHKQYLLGGGMTMNAGNKADAELLRLIESPSDTVLIDEVSFGTTSSVVIGRSAFIGDESWVDIIGGIYIAPAGEYETK